MGSDPGVEGDGRYFFQDRDQQDGGDPVRVRSKISGQGRIRVDQEGDGNDDIGTDDMGRCNGERDAVILKKIMVKYHLSSEAAEKYVYAPR